MSHSAAVNSTESILPCLSNHSMSDADEMPDTATKTGITALHVIKSLWFEVQF